MSILQGLNTGVIRSANASNIASAFYFDGNGYALIGDTSGNYLRWNGESLEIAGTITRYY